MDFIKKHRSHISGTQRCIRWWERRRWQNDLRKIKKSKIFERSDLFADVDGKSKNHV